MSLFQAAVLGVVQGLSEFLPISSSGHLIIIPRVFGWHDQGLAFDVILHLGTLAALLWYFRDTFVTLLRRAVTAGPDQAGARRMIAQWLIASVPALMVGYVLREIADLWTRNVSLVAFNLAFWGIILWVADRCVRHGRQSVQGLDQGLSWRSAIGIGTAQVLALLPGTSRSGVTITAGLLAGLSRETAARWSFLLSIPVTAAAGGHGLWTLVRDPERVSAEGLALGVGFLAAFFSGVLAIRFLVSYVAKQSYDVFVAYRLLLAVGLLFLVYG